MVPDTVGGLPLHALVVHGAVVLVPLAGLLGVVFAVPRLRRWAMVPLPLAAIGAAGATWVATRSGEALMQVGGLGAEGLGGPVAEIIEQHEELGEQLFVMVLVYAGLAVVAAVVAGRAERTGGGSRVLGTVLAVLLVIGAGVIGFQTYRVGDLGAEAVWDPTGNVDYETE